VSAEFTRFDQPQPVRGVRIASAAAGIRRPDRKDVLLVELAPGTRTAAVFTRNRFCAAPVTVARENLATASPRLLIFNAGNANAGTGTQGIADARKVTAAIAAAGDCTEAEVLPFSTGVIGERLPSDKLCAQAQALHRDLDENNWLDGATAIMTTDTVAKTASIRVSIDGSSYQISGLCKGSGMIHPNMATMLAFVATDAPLDASCLDAILATAVATTFNRITVDGDTSTNDACVLSATGAAGGEPMRQDHPHVAAITEGITRACEILAQAIVRDGEGATKFVEIEVLGPNEADCHAVANTVALSPLVKTALFASDPNWGRILAAVGRAPVASLELGAISIWLGDCQIVEHGEPCPGYDEAHADRVMAREEIKIRIIIGEEHASCRVWTCDFSYDYVRINAEYRS